MNRFGLSAEQTLVLDLVSHPQGPQQDKALKERLSKISPKEFLKVLPPELAPYSLHVLETRGFLESTPAQIVEVLQKARQSSLIRSLRQLNLAREVVQAWERAGIPCIALKGLALSQTLYPYPYLRPMNDMDFLVRSEDQNHAEGVLEGLGFFRTKRGSLRLPLEPNPDETQLLKRIGPVVYLVELHFALDHAALLPPQWSSELWARSGPLDLGGTSSKILHPTDQWQSLCLHLAAKHSFESALRWLLDLRLLLESWGDRINWEEVAVSCRTPADKFRHQLVLKVLSDFLGVPITPAARVLLSEQQDLSLDCQQALQQIFGPLQKPVGLPPSIIDGLFLQPAKEGLNTLTNYARRLFWEDSEKRQPTWKGVALFPARLAFNFWHLLKVLAQIRFSPRRLWHSLSAHKRRAHLQQRLFKSR